MDSDIIVDFRLAFRDLSDKVYLPRFFRGCITASTREDGIRTTLDRENYDMPNLHTWMRDRYTAETNLLTYQEPGDLTRDSYILLPSYVYGFVLKSRKWRTNTPSPNGRRSSY